MYMYLRIKIAAEVSEKKRANSWAKIVHLRKLLLSAERNIVKPVDEKQIKMNTEQNKYRTFSWNMKRLTLGWSAIAKTLQETHF